MNDRCDWVRARLGRLLDAELPGEERAAVEEHCAVCAACRALCDALRAADQTARATMLAEPAGDGTFERRWAEFQRRYDLTAAEELRAQEARAEAGAPARMSGEEVAAAPLEPAVTAPREDLEPHASRVRRILAGAAGWLAPRPGWRWASLATGAVAVAIITTVLIARGPRVEPPSAAVQLPLDAVRPTPSAPTANAAGESRAPATAPSAAPAGEREAAATPPAPATEQPRVLTPPAPPTGLDRVLTPPGTAAMPSSEQHLTAVASEAKKVGATAPPSSIVADERQPAGAAVSPQVAAPEAGGGTWGALRSMDRGLTRQPAGERAQEEAVSGPADAEIGLKLAAAAGEFGIEAPENVAGARPAEVARLLGDFEQVLQLREELAGGTTAQAYAHRARADRGHAERATGDLAVRGEALRSNARAAKGRGSEADGKSAAAPPATARDVADDASLWVLAGDGWYMLWQRSRPSGDEDADARSTAVSATAPDTLAARALQAYERALEIGPAQGEEAQELPPHASARAAQLRAHLTRRMPPAAAPVQRRR